MTVGWVLNELDRFLFTKGYFFNGVRTMYGLAHSHKKQKTSLKCKVNCASPVQTKLNCRMSYSPPTTTNPASLGPKLLSKEQTVIVQL